MGLSCSGWGGGVVINLWCSVAGVGWLCTVQYKYFTRWLWSTVLRYGGSLGWGVFLVVGLGGRFWVGYWGR